MTPPLRTDVHQHLWPAELLEARGAPPFVHPGPAHDPDHDGAPWWPALTAHIASLQAAWWAWATVGLAAHPRLRENPERLLR
jgi:hypothetical protein